MKNNRGQTRGCASLYKYPKSSTLYLLKSIFTVSTCAWVGETVMRRGLCAMCDQSQHFMFGWSGGIWPACCHWLNTSMVDGCCWIIFVLIQSYPCDTWFVWCTLRELAVSNLDQLLFFLSIMWSRCCNAHWDLWIMTIQCIWYCVPSVTHSD